MIPPSFEYHAPKSVGEAVALLGQYGSDAKLLAGGHSLLPMMKLRFAQPEHLIDINRIPELRGICEEGNTVVIGAMTVENDLIDHQARFDLKFFGIGQAQVGKHITRATMHIQAFDGFILHFRHSLTHASAILSLAWMSSMSSLGVAMPRLLFFWKQWRTNTASANLTVYTAR